MAVKNIVIVDTVGNIEDLNQKYLSSFPFVKEWHGHEPPRSKGSIPHPHGGMCMGQALMPLWDDSEDIHAHFIRIFDSNGSVIKDGPYQATKFIREILESGPTWVNNSWGTYIGAKDTLGYIESSLPWRDLIEETGVSIFWAAGNSGDFDLDVDEDLPQGLLTDISAKISAANRDGKPAIYSSDSLVAPPLASFWGTRVRLMNPINAQWEIASGTSFAAPKATGLAAKRNLNFSSFSELASLSSTYPKGYTGPRPHPKWGFGWLEHEYQKEIRDCPFRFEVVGPKLLESQVTLSWLEMELKNDALIREEFGK